MIKLQISGYIGLFAAIFKIYNPIEIISALCSFCIELQYVISLAKSTNKTI